MATTTQPANRFQEQFGTPKGRAVTKVRDYMTPYVKEFISQSPFVIMATSDHEGHCDTSPKGASRALSVFSMINISYYPMSRATSSFSLMVIWTTIPMSACCF